jgi:small subunit ribosomal protein S29
MASRTTCLRLLRRPAAWSSSSLPCAWCQAALFSTTLPAAAATPVKGGAGGKDSRQKKGGKINLDRFKKEQKRPTKQPLPGERKAYRKRIVLTNDNALTVEGATDLTSASMVNQDNVGTMLRLPDKLVDQLRAAEAFKTTQCWNLFRWPHVLLRQSGLDVAKKMQKDLQTKHTTRLVLMGDKSVGKSMLLLQTIANAYSNDWIVVNIPEGSFRPQACRLHPQCANI